MNDPNSNGAAATPGTPGDAAAFVAATGHFGLRLGAAMRLRGYHKAAALANAMKVNEAAISRWKRGGPIALVHAVQLCDTLGVSMDWLIRGIGQPEPLARSGSSGTAPGLSGRTVDEVRALLRFMEEQSDDRLARSASGTPRHARDS